MSMIKEFCEINYQNPSDKSRQQKLFIDNGRNLAVAGVDYKDLREKIMGEFPVISISFKGIEGNTFLSAVSALINMISSLYDRFLFLRDSQRQSAEKKENFSEIYRFCTTKSKILTEGNNLTEAQEICCTFISTLAEMLFKEYERKVIVMNGVVTGNDINPNRIIQLRQIS